MITGGGAPQILEVFDISAKASKRYRETHKDEWDNVLKMRRDAVTRKTPQEIERDLEEINEKLPGVIEERRKYTKAGGAESACMFNSEYWSLTSQRQRLEAAKNRLERILSDMRTGKYIEQLERLRGEYTPKDKQYWVYDRLIRKQSKAIDEWVKITD